jgi:hypothetical protein
MRDDQSVLLTSDYSTQTFRRIVIKTSQDGDHDEKE